MAEVMGFGDCPLCHEPVTIGQPARYHSGTGHGNVMAHKSCFDKEKAEHSTVAYRLQQAQEKVARAESAVAAAVAELDGARQELHRISEEAH